VASALHKFMYQKQIPGGSSVRSNPTMSWWCPPFSQMQWPIRPHSSLKQTRCTDAACEYDKQNIRKTKC